MLISRQILELGTHFVGRNNCIFTSCSIQSLSGTQDTHTANLRFYWHKWKYFSRILVMISLAECQAQDWFKFCIKMACVLVVLGGQQPVSNLDVTKTFLLCHFVRNSYPVIQKDRNLGASNWSSRLTHKSKFFLYTYLTVSIFMPSGDLASSDASDVEVVIFHVVYVKVFFTRLLKKA
jgi:hypothetical protein